MAKNHRDARIRELAYALWDREGQPDDQAERHWRIAEDAIQKLELAEAAAAMNAGRSMTEDSIAAVPQTAGEAPAPTRSKTRELLAKKSSTSRRRSTKPRPKK